MPKCGAMVDQHAYDTATVGTSEKGEDFAVDRFEFVTTLCKESIGWLVMCPMNWP